MGTGLDAKVTPFVTRTVSVPVQPTLLAVTVYNTDVLPLRLAIGLDIVLLLKVVLGDHEYAVAVGDVTDNCDVSPVQVYGGVADIALKVIGPPTLTTSVADVGQPLFKIPDTVYV